MRWSSSFLMNLMYLYQSSRSAMPCIVKMVHEDSSTKDKKSVTQIYVMIIITPSNRSEFSVRFIDMYCMQQ